jgi:hypothetical protein
VLPLTPSPARVASRFSDQYDSAGTLSGVDSSLAKEMAQSGLLDGDTEDDKVSIKSSPIKSTAVNPSQTTLVLKDVVGIALEMLLKREGMGEDLGAIVSSDGYILDGHHRWAGSILARGSRASVKVWKASIPGEQLVRVLNIVSKGHYGVSSGNSGKGSINDLTPAKVRKQLEVFLREGRQHKHFSMTSDQAAKILETNFGSVEKGVDVLSERARLIPKSVPSWAPSRDQMPVIRRKNAPGAAKLLNQGVVDWASPYADAQRVAARHQVRQVARRVAADLGLDAVTKTGSSAGGHGSEKHSLRGITAEALSAFAEAFWLPQQGGVRRASLRSLAKRLKQLGQLFKKAPRLWEQFKRLLGVESLTDLPRLLKELAAQGKKTLGRFFGKALNTFPLQIFTIKGAGLNDLLRNLSAQVPGLDKALSRVKAGADVLGDWLRKHTPRLSKVLIIAAFIFIWMNVVEFEWNISDLGNALTGNIALGDLLASLPGSTLGFLMNGLGFGTFTLLPAALVARILWLMHKGYIVWDGRWFDLDAAALQRDGYEVVPVG